MRPAWSGESHPFDHRIQFPSSGLYTVTARAQDDSGRTTESVRQIEITPPADQVATPVISPTTGGYRSSRTVTITCSTPGATILYVVTSSFGSPPETGWLTYNPSAKPVVPVESRIWAKATLAGFADSGLAFVYYWFDEPDWNRGGNYLIP